MLTKVSQAYSHNIRYPLYWNAPIKGTTIITKNCFPLSSSTTSLLLLPGSQQSLDQPDHWRDKVLEGAELVGAGVQHKVCEGPHCIEANIEAGVVHNGPVAFLKIGFSGKKLC